MRQGGGSQYDMVPLPATRACADLGKTCDRINREFDPDYKNFHPAG